MLPAGEFYHADRIERSESVFEQVAAEVRTIYSVAYTPKNFNFDGSFRRIQVQVNRPGLHPHSARLLREIKPHWGSGDYITCTAPGRWS
jgi:hypothetical protein